MFLGPRNRGCPIVVPFALARALHVALALRTEKLEAALMGWNSDHPSRLASSKGKLRGRKGWRATKAARG